MSTPLGLITGVTTAIGAAEPINCSGSQARPFTIAVTAVLERLKPNKTMTYE
jgi:hypothetical protein